MSTLIAYYSMKGNNKKLAQYLNEKYGFDLFEIQEKKKRKTFSILLDAIFKKRKCKLADYDINLSAYDNVVLMGPVWMGSVCKPVIEFINREKERVKSFNFISVCGGENKAVLLKDNFYLAIDKAPKKVLQIGIYPLIPEELRKDIRYVMNYKITDEDIEKYTKEIEKFFDIK